MSRRIRDWAGLPPDILRLIAQLLKSSADFIRFGAVCRSWKTMATHQNYTPYSLYQLPWLLPERQTDAPDTWAFYILSTRKLAKLRIPEVVDKRVCGSSCGWLITTADGPRPELLNPLSGVRFTLPLPSTSSLVRKVVLSSSMMAMAIQGKRLAYAMAGDEAWSSIELNLVGDDVLDVVCCMDQFYVLTDLQMVMICEFGWAGSRSGTASPRMARVARIPLLPQLANELYRPRDGAYLVESEGELLAVVRYMKISLNLKLANDEIEHWFQVFKLKIGDEDLKASWVKVKSLGNRALFVNSGACMSLSAELSGCRENSVYFYQYPRVEVFCLDTGTVIDHYRLGDQIVDYGRNPDKTPFWVTPILW